MFGSPASNLSSRLSPGLRRCLWEGACTSLKTWVSIPSTCLKVRCVCAHLWALCYKGRRQDKGWGLLDARWAKENPPTPDSERDPVKRLRWRMAEQSTGACTGDTWEGPPQECWWHALSRSTHDHGLVFSHYINVWLSLCAYWPRSCASCSYAFLSISVNSESITLCPLMAWRQFIVVRYQGLDSSLYSTSYKTGNR